MIKNKNRIQALFLAVSNTLLMRSILFSTVVLVIIAGIFSCTQIEQNNGGLYPAKFETIYYLEIDDGKNTEVLDGYSKSTDANRFSEYPNENLTIISYNTFGNKYDEVKGITGMILLDEKEHLYPFGETHAPNEFKTGLIITTSNKYIRSQRTGIQELNDVKYYTPGAKKQQGKVTFQYYFKDVPFKDYMTMKDYKVSGHIVSSVLE